MGLQETLFNTVTTDHLHEACAQSIPALQAAGRRMDPEEFAGVLAGDHEEYAAFLVRFSGVLSHQLEAEGVTGAGADKQVRGALLGLHILDQCGKAQQREQFRARITRAANRPNPANPPE